jgi:hypothetical protein
MILPSPPIGFLGKIATGFPQDSALGFHYGKSRKKTRYFPMDFPVSNINISTISINKRNKSHDLYRRS